MAKTREREKTKGRERVRKAKRPLRPKQKVQEPFSQALVRRSPSTQIRSEQQYGVFASFPKTALAHCFSFWLSRIFSCFLSVIRCCDSCDSDVFHFAAQRHAPWA